MRAYEIINLINYTVNKVVPKKYQELEKVAILAKIEVISKTTKKDLTKEQVLEVIYKELEVKNI